MAKSSKKPGGTPGKSVIIVKKRETFGGQLPTSENRPTPPKRPNK